MRQKKVVQVAMDGDKLLERIPYYRKKSTNSIMQHIFPDRRQNLKRSQEELYNFVDSKRHDKNREC